MTREEAIERGRRMTREEAIEEFRHSIAMSKLDLKVNKKNMSIEREIMVLNSIARNEMAIHALEQEPILDKIEDEIHVACEDLDCYNPDSLITFACRVDDIIDKYKEGENA